MAASSEFTIGMGEGRNSSRVLKPPGGGHSQIFGEPEEEAPRKKHAVCEINGCFTQQVQAKTTTRTTTETQVIEDLKQDENNTNGNNIDTTTNGGHMKPEEGFKNGQHEPNNKSNEERTDSAPQRKRVPPGGYSSGAFW